MLQENPPNSPRLTVRKRGRRPATSIDGNGVEIGEQIATPRKARHVAPPIRGPPDATATIAKFQAISSLSRASVYRMINRGDLRSITVGTRRLILLSSWHQLIAKQLAEQEG